MRGLEQLAERIVQLNVAQQAELPLGEALREALETYRRIPTADARRREIRHLARLLATIPDELEAIRASLARYDAASAAFTRELHTLEAWRDAMIERDDAIKNFLDRFPKADRQHLRQRVRAARTEARAGTDKRAYRALFRTLRAILLDAGSLEPPSQP